MPGSFLPRQDAVQFISRVCGLKLREFQVDWLRELFREKDGKRVYSEALLGLPRGNGKTELAAGVALYLLVADGAKQPQVVIAAGSDKQASEAFDAAKSMVRESKLLRKKIEVLPGRKVIRWIDDDNAWLRTVSAEGPLQHGMKPTAVVFDEVWNQKKRELWEALIGGLIKRPEPLLVCISSAGYDRSTVLGELCARGEQGDSPRFFYKWYSAPDELDWRDPETWRLANPALACGEPFLQLTGLEDNATRMHESEFRRWHLGQWTSAEDAWLDAPTWDANDAVPLLDRVTDTYIGVDASIRHDSTVVATVQRDAGGFYNVSFKFWTPTPGREVEMGVVMDFVRKQTREFKVIGVAYDPQFMHHAAQTLESEGIQMVEWPQNNARMVPATRTLHEAVVNARIRHGGDRQAREHALAAGVKETERGLRLRKTEVTAGKQMDAVIALAMAVDLASLMQRAGRSVYEDRFVAA